MKKVRNSKKTKYYEDRAKGNLGNPLGTLHGKAFITAFDKEFGLKPWR